jgi:hypothetical protein
LGKARRPPVPRGCAFRQTTLQQLLVSDRPGKQEATKPRSCMPARLRAATLAGPGYYRRHSRTRPEPSQNRACSGVWACLASQEAEDHLFEQWDSTYTVVLALGAGYFLVNHDGSTAWDDVPIELHNKVNGRQKSRPPVDYVVLGEGDYYFVQVRRPHMLAYARVCTCVFTCMLWWAHMQRGGLQAPKRGAYVSVHMHTHAFASRCTPAQHACQESCQQFTS